MPWLSLHLNALYILQVSDGTCFVRGFLEISIYSILRILSWPFYHFHDAVDHRIAKELPWLTLSCCLYA